MTLYPGDRILTTRDKTIILTIVNYCGLSGLSYFLEAPWYADFTDSYRALHSSGKEGQINARDTILISRKVKANS